MRDYLTNRKQRVVIPGGTSDWQFIRAGVPQGSILGPLLFLLYINDIVADIQSCVRLFADGTSLYIIVDNPISAAEMIDTDLETIHRWAEKWLVKLNPSKSGSRLVSRKNNRNMHPSLIMNTVYINEVQHHKHLGVILSNDDTWHEHINLITSKAWQRIYVMRKLKFMLDRDSLNKVYISFIRPTLEYAYIVGDNCTQYETNAIERIQIEVARIVTGATRLVSLDMLSKETGWESLWDRRYKHKMCQFYKMINDLTPTYLTSSVPSTVENTSAYNLRDSQNIRPLLTRTQLYYKYFYRHALENGMKLLLIFETLNIRNSTSLSSFKQQLNKNNIKVPVYYSPDNRLPHIHHTRLRTKCSSLNQHLHSKNIIDDPLCACGSVETANHFLLESPQYIQARRDMITALSAFCVPSLNNLLYGDTTLNNHQNKLIFLTVQKCISDSKRFVLD